MKIKSLLLSCILLVLTGCMNAIYSAPLDGYILEKEEKTGTIKIFREDSFQGGGAHAVLSMDGQSFSKLNTNQYLELDVPEGVHSISAASREGPSVEINFEIQEQEIKYLVIAPNSDQMIGILLPMVAANMEPFVLRWVTEKEFSDYVGSAEKSEPLYKLSSQK